MLPAIHLIFRNISWLWTVDDIQCVYNSHCTQSPSPSPYVFQVKLHDSSDNNVVIICSRFECVVLCDNRVQIVRRLFAECVWTGKRKKLPFADVSRMMTRKNPNFTAFIDQIKSFEIFRTLRTRCYTSDVRERVCVCYLSPICLRCALLLMARCIRCLLYYNACNVPVGYGWYVYLLIIYFLTCVRTYYRVGCFIYNIMWVSVLVCVKYEW